LGVVKKRRSQPDLFTFPLPATSLLPRLRSTRLFLAEFSRESEGMIHFRVEGGTRMADRPRLMTIDEQGLLIAEVPSRWRISLQPSAIDILQSSFPPPRIQNADPNALRRSDFNHA
jgi:hypothetical protein